MATCCRDYNYHNAQFRAVFDLTGARWADVDVRDLGRYQRAFDEQLAK